MNRTHQFFQRASDDYHHLIRTGNAFQFVRPIVEPRMGEKVLDVGNGGLKEFFPSCTSLYVGLDFSLEMLKRGPEKEFQSVCGSALALPFKNTTFNTVLYSSLLHHLLGRRWKDTCRAVRTALLQGHRCLEKGGNVIIIEPCFPKFLERMERFCLFILRAFFYVTGQPDAFIFSRGSLEKFLLDCGYEEIQTWNAGLAYRNKWKWVSPCIGFPLLKIPQWLNPVKKIVFEARKG